MIDRFVTSLQVNPDASLVVRDFNTTIDSVPTNVLASFFRFAKRSYFELDSQQDRQAPRVAFGS